MPGFVSLLAAASVPNTILPEGLALTAGAVVAGVGAGFSAAGGFSAAAGFGGAAAGEAFDWVVGAADGGGGLGAWAAGGLGAQPATVIIAPAVPVQASSW